MKLLKYFLVINLFLNFCIYSQQDTLRGNLDSTSAKEIMDIFCKLNEEKKMTVVIITHNQAVAERTKRIYHLKDGQIVDEVV